MDGCVTNQRAAAHLIEEVSHASQTTESEILLYSSRCTGSFREKCVFGISGRTHEMGCSVLCEQQRSSCSAFRYLFVQRKGKTTYRNTTLIPISLRCNPLSSNFFLQGLILFLIAPFQLSFSSLGFVSQLPLQAADIGKALQFLRKVIFVQDRVSTVLHHF